jgi:hypothetical protein
MVRKIVDKPGKVGSFAMISQRTSKCGMYEKADLDKL